MQRSPRGFSLLEVTLAVGLIGILSSVTLTALNPAYFMAKGRNAQRWMDLDSLIDSVAAFTIDNDGYIPPNIQIPPTTSSKAVFSGAYVIDADFKGAKAILVEDIDGDGTEEVVGTGAQGNSKDVSVWERSGTAPHFTWAQTTVDGSNWKGVDVAIGDMDGDSRKDIVSVDSSGRDIAWWRNLGGAPATFGSRLNIETNYLGVISLALANFDGVNGMDVVATSNNLISALLKAVQWYDNDGTPLNGGWSTIIVENLVLGSNRQVVAADIDGDADQDVLTAENSHLFAPEYLLLYQNDGTPEGANWTQVTIDNGENGARGVAVGDIDGDVDTDIVGISLTGQVEWFENDGTPFTGGAWTQHTITSSFGGETIVARDIDNDGDTDVIAASSGGDKIAYWENIGAGSFSGTFVIDFGTELDGVSDIAIADIDEDGDQDIVAANNVKRSVSWWMNLQIGGESEPAPQGAIDASYKPVCRADISVVECDAYGGVSLDVLIPGFLAAIPIDPSYETGEGSGAVLTGYEISIDTDARKLSVRAPLAELDETIELIGPVGVENCLVWDIVQSERTCILFE